MGVKIPFKSASGNPPRDITPKVVDNSRVQFGEVIANYSSPVLSTLFEATTPGVITYLVIGSLTTPPNNSLGSHEYKITRNGVIIFDGNINDIFAQFSGWLLGSPVHSATHGVEHSVSVISHPLYFDSFKIEARAITSNNTTLFGDPRSTM